MRYEDTGEYEILSEITRIVEINDEFCDAHSLYGFECGVEDMNIFLYEHALDYQKWGMSKTHLLIDNETNDILGYISLCSSSILLTPTERTGYEIKVGFSSIPAINIGKLATSIDHRDKGFHYGSYLLYIAYAYASDAIDAGVAARFLTLDANVENNPTLVEFYEKNGFIVNSHKDYIKRTGKVSMRYDLFR